MGGKKPPHNYSKGRYPKTLGIRKYNRYKVVLYRNQKQRKFIYQHRLFSCAKQRFDDMLANTKVYFPQKWDWLGKPIKYELVLLGNFGNALQKYRAPSGVVYDVKREKDDGFFIKAIEPFEVEEKFKYYQHDAMFTFKDFIAFLMKQKYTKTLTRFNNKILIEIFETEEMHLFIYKNVSDSKRFYALVKKFYYENQMCDCFFFNKPIVGADLRAFSKRLSEKLGIKRDEIKKISTRA